MNDFWLYFFPSNFFLLNSKMPEREEDHLTPATRLLEKRREMADVENALAAEKEVFIRNE